MTAAAQWLRWLEENGRYWDTHTLKEERMSEYRLEPAFGGIRVASSQGPDYSAKVRELDAQCAALRRVFPWLIEKARTADGHDASLGPTTDCAQCGAIKEAEAALAPDAGKALLERLEKAEQDARDRAEAERDEAQRQLRERILGIQKARAGALEEAAGVAEDADDGTAESIRTAGRISAAIRALAKERT